MLKSLILVVLFFFPFCTSIDTLTLNQSIKDGPDGQSLVSKEENFALGFFSPGNSSYRYLGIWYVKVTVKTVVWVANRNNPINGSSGVLSINQYGNLVLYDSYNRSLWYTNVSFPATTSSVAQLLDSGNLVIVQEGNNSVLWQSSDDPTDTLLPRIQFGLNRRTGVDTILTSWKSQDDPGTGDCLYQLNPNGSPQFYLYKDSTLHRRSWPWPWCSAVDTRSVDYNINFVYDQEEISYSYFFDDPSIITRMILNNSGSIQLLRWNDGVGQWNEVWSAPRLRCEKYGLCGPYSICSSDNINTFECSCLPGYEPKNQRDWYLRNGSEGCVRNRTGLSMCGNGEGFVKVAGLKVPDTSYAVWVGMSMSRAECEQECLRNCNCTAYVSVELNNTGTGCLAYHGELMDSTGDEDEGWELNVRADATEIAKYYKKNSKGFLAKNRKLVIAVLSVAVLLFLGSLLACIWLLRRKKTKEKRKMNTRSFNFTGTKSSLERNQLEGSDRHPDALVFDLSSIVVATDNFSPTNKLGEGGFGSVFKGQLSNGRQIAVKRFSKSSGQGIEEFKNEVMLIAKLQHRNLVKILGCCIEGEEKMLIYEYMPNKSLDFFIFDHTRSSSLSWKKRFEIIIEIARGILYLHQDSRLRIIHRDLKPSNILLDAEMHPKISDFGMARIFKTDQIGDKTTRVVGTYGYMSPEYAAFGEFSTKSDVFSFGVILLEIVSGKKNNHSYQEHPSLTLIGHVWELWREDKVMGIVDSCIDIESYVSHEALRCIQIGLLCVQEEVMDRPTMTEVVLMLSSETALSSPKQPAFIFKRASKDLDTVAEEGPHSVNEVTITKVEAR